MPNLSIKGVPEEWAARLRMRAARNHRSLQGELMAILERAISDDPRVLAEWPTVRHGLDANAGARRVMRQGWKTVEQVAAELRSLHPEPIRQQASSIELIREDRDSR